MEFVTGVGGVGVVVFGSATVGCCSTPLAEVAGEWVGDNEGDVDVDVDGGSNGIVIQGWFRMSSSLGRSDGRSLKHRRISSWHSKKEEEQRR